jgi:hypothetical protein
MTEDDRDVFLGAQVGKPVPGAQACDRHDNIGPVRGNGSSKGFRVRLPMAMDQDLATLVEDADGPSCGHAGRYRSKMGAACCTIALRSPPDS